VKRWKDFSVVEGVHAANVNNMPVLIGLLSSGMHGIVSVVSGGIGDSAMTVGCNCPLYYWSVGFCGQSSRFG